MRPLVVTREGAVRVISGMQRIADAIDTTGEAHAVDVSTGSPVRILADRIGVYYALPGTDHGGDWQGNSAA